MVKVPVVNREFYVMYLELFEGMLWFHTDVHRWNKEVKKKYLEDLETLHHLVSVPLVALVDEHDSKLAKFGKIIGFEYNRPLKGKDNEIYEIYSRSL